MQTTLRNGDLGTLVELLREQRTRAVDFTAPVDAVRYEGGLLHVDAEPLVSDEGVTSVSGFYQPWQVFEEGVAEKFGIPGGYLAKLRGEGRIELVDAIVNHLMHGSQGRTPEGSQVNPADARRFLFRLLRGDDTGSGVARALLSDKFRPIDNVDVLVACLAGVKDSGLEVEIGKCDLSERRMYVQVNAPSVQALAPALLKGYRSPFTGEEGNANPIMFAGFVIANSDTGGAAFTLTPRIVVQVCKNGMTITRDAMREVHLGVKRTEGIVSYSAETIAKQVELITLKARDAVKTFLDVDYVKAKIAELEATAATPITSPEKTIKAVIRAATLPVSLEESVLDHFIKGGQMTAGGVMQAVTAAAQGVESPDVQYELEGKAEKVLSLAAQLSDIKGDARSAGWLVKSS